MADRARSHEASTQTAWERAWRERYERPERAPGRAAARRGSVRHLLFVSAVLGVTVSSVAVAGTGDDDPGVSTARGEGAAIALGERNPGSGESSRETAIVADAGNSGLVLRPSNTAKGGRAVSATCDNDGQEAEDGCAVYVNKGTGAAASFRTQGSVPFAIRDTNTGLVQHLNSDMVDGKHATDFLGATAKAADADSLDGRDSSSFLGATAKAADAETVDGKDSGAFLEATAKAADANSLDGKDSSEFLGSTAQAADSNTLDGRDSQSFVRFAGSVSSTGTSSGSGFTSSRVTTGQYFVSFPAGTFPPNPSGSCTVPIAVATPTTGSLRFATIAGSQCSPGGSGGFTVETYVFDDINAEIDQVDAPFNFVAY
jgi:hypothetical protein